MTVFDPELEQHKFEEESREENKNIISTTGSVFCLFLLNYRLGSSKILPIRGEGVDEGMVRVPQWGLDVCCILDDAVAVIWDVVSFSRGV